MRTKNTIKNMIASMGSNIINILIGFVAQAIFVKTLGSTILGLNGLFTNIVSMLSIVEIGIGDAIIYSLYKPIADKNKKQIQSLMHFYKKSYHIIGMVIFALGLCLLPFLSFFVKEAPSDVSIYLVFLLFLVDVTISYFLSYKRSILYANQRNYIIIVIHILYVLFMNTFEIMILLTTKNYYLYLMIKIVMRFLENLAITISANKIYPYLREKAEVLNKETEKEIFKKVKALFLHKIGVFIVQGTDNILISKFFGLASVGIYSSYYMVINSIQLLFGQIVNATAAGVGNLLVTEKREKQFAVFKRIQFLNFWLVTFSGTCLLVLLHDFVIVWLGKEFLLPSMVVFVLVLAFYFNLMRNTFMIFKSAAGIFYEDRFVPIIESVSNVLFSILFLYIFGLEGVFMGTIVSGLVLYVYSYPKFVYKQTLGGSYRKYVFENMGYLCLFLVILLGTYQVSLLVHTGSLFLTLFLKLLICLVIPNLLMVILFFKTKVFRTNIETVLGLLHKGKGTSYEKNSI